MSMKLASSGVVEDFFLLIVWRSLDAHLVLVGVRVSSSNAMKEWSVGLGARILDNDGRAFSRRKLEVDTGLDRASRLG